MNQFTEQDLQYMQLAIELAKKGQYTTAPNPNVGCVLVKNGEIVGQGYHHKAGEPHAEVMALRDAGNKAKGAIAYVTLEPCSHFGRTPPCALGLIEAGVSKVIVAMTDPNPQVAGRGLRMLQEANIETEVGLLEEESEQLNKGFLMRMRKNRPFVRLKLAMSIDGKTAMANGESQWITGTEARRDVQKERARSAAILSASGTVLYDNPSLNVRWSELPKSVKNYYSEEKLRQPTRIILDSKNQISDNYRLFEIASPVWLIGKTERDLADYPDFVEQILIEEKTDSSRLKVLMTELASRQINDLWVEAGATLAGELISENLVDELIIYLAPKLLGAEARSLCNIPNLTHLADAPLWALIHQQQIGEDLKLVFKRKEPC